MYHAGKDNGTIFHYVTMPSSLSSKQLYVRLLRHVRPYWTVFAANIIALVIQALTQPAFSALLKPLLDGSFVHRDPVLIRVIPLAIIGLFIIRGVGNFVAAYCSAWVSGRVVMDLQLAMFRKIVSLPASYFSNNSSGNLIATTAFNVTQVTQAATTVVTSVVSDGVAIIGLLGWMLWLNWKLTLVSLISGPIIALIVRLVSRRLRRLSRLMQLSLGDTTHVLEEAVEGHKVIKVFGGQQDELRRFEVAVNQSRRYQLKQQAAAAANVPIVQLVAAIAFATIVWLATLQSAAGVTTVGSFISFITAMMMLFAPIKRLTGINEQLQRGLAAAEIVFDLVDEASETDTGTRALDRAVGRLDFEHVALTYPEAGKPALADFDLTIHAGETVALVGASGAGKTSLANLLPRFYAPTAGRILLDGVDIADIRLADLRTNLSLVSQDVVLFNGSIRDNIAYGPLKTASETAIIAAAEAAHAMEFIRQLPQGLDTPVGENGLKLSGGQRQRLAIARALLKDAPILILDEATSALDTESERHVQQALETLMQGRTTLVIAHRLSTVEKADRIVVMQDGRILETGTHQELLACPEGAYARLHGLQLVGSR